MKYIGNIGPKIDVNLFYLDLDTKKISEEIIQQKLPRKVQDPLSTYFEDYPFEPLPNSETEKLFKTIKNQFKEYNVEMWVHMHHPLESTTIHHHGMDGLSFAFYAKVPQNSGIFVVMPAGNGGPSIPIPPIEGSLILFPSWVQHMVTKNLSKELRICISGNLHKKQNDFNC